MQAADIKIVGIIGAGHIGQVMAQIALRAGRRVVIANSRGPQSLTSVAQELGNGTTPVLGSDPHESGGQRVIFRLG